MEKVIINDDNISEKDINKTVNKVRAILLVGDKLLVSHYAGVILLPGGGVEKGETDDQAIIRELQEEIGITYDINDLEKMLLIEHYQHNFPTRDNETINRLVRTKFYLGDFRGIDLTKCKRTESEIRDNFYLELMSIEYFMNSVNEISSNPRKKYFDKENQDTIKMLKMISS